MECPICYKDKSIDSFYELRVGLVGEEPVASCIVQEGCKDCLQSKDIKIKPKTRKTLCPEYQITNIPHYENLKQKNYAKEIFGESKFFTLGDIADTLVERGFLETQNPSKGERGKCAKKFILKRNKKDPNFPSLRPVPYWSYDYPNNSIRSYRLVMTETDLDKFIKMLEEEKGWSYLHQSGVHQLSLEKLFDLCRKGYVKMAESGNAYFRDNLKDQLRVCRYCGNILPFDCFDTVKKNLKRYSAAKCKSCRSSHDRQTYKNKSEEEKAAFRKQCRDWRLKNKQRVKEYSKTPKTRMRRAVRKRLKDFMRTKPNNYNREVGVTNAELTAWIESLWKEGMSWQNYGVGENGDHEGAWHVDHKIPLAKWETHGKMLEGYFEGMSPNHYLNLQPLWSWENMKKAAQCNISTNEPFIS